MDIIKCIVVALIIGLFCWGTGFSMNKLMKNTKISNMSLGFITILALFQIISLPFMWFESEFTILYTICLALMCVVIVYNFVNIRKVEISCDNFLSKDKLFWFVSIGLIVGQIICYIILQHSDADDAFFVTQISTIIEANKINNIDCSTGIKDFIFSPQYKLVGWEVLLSVFCKLFRMNAATFCHTCLPLVLLVVHYFIVWDIAKEMHMKRPVIPFALFCILNMFGGYSVYTRESFLFFRIWQGKAVYVNIVLPMMLLLFLKLFKKGKEIESKNIILLCFVLYASLNTTTVGIYLGPLAYGIYVLTYTIFSKRLKSFLKLCIPVICVLPNVIMKFLYLIRFSTIEDASVGYDTFDWMSWLSLVMGNRLYLVAIFAILILIILIKGNKIEKHVFGIYPILCMVTFLNPLFSKFVSGHITGVPVYWRLFWNLQLTFIVVAAICIVARNVQYRMPMLFMVICIVLCQNGFIYIRENFEWIKNPEKANATSYNIVKTLEDDSISEDITIFAPEEYTYDIRQISGKIKLAWSRYAHPEDLCGIYSYIYENRTISQDMIEILKEHGINYLVLYQGTEFANMSKNNKSVYSDENIIMFRVY